MKRVYCDKCKSIIKEGQFLDDWGSQFGEFESKLSGKISLDIHLCKKCKKKFDEIVDKFIREG